jgi:microcystin-dependent protein
VEFSGAVATAQGGTGVVATPAPNQVLLGTGAGYNLTTLQAGVGINFDQSQANKLIITNTGGSGGSGNTITLADMPPGSIQYFAMQTAPDGWLVCDGSTLNKATNPAYIPLWAAIQYTYGGSGDTFNLPDLRGEFIRGWSQGRTGVDTGRAFGSAQADDFKSHTHGLNTGTGNGGQGFPGEFQTAWVSNLQGRITATGGTETRPRNVALLPCIKFKPGVVQTAIVTSVNVGSTVSALTFSGGPVTSSGTITMNATGGSASSFLRGDGTWAGTLPNLQVFTASTSWTVPAGITRVKVTMVGGGGGGGSGGSNGQKLGQGGGDGGRAIAIISGLVPGASITVTIGTAGTGSTYGGTNYGTTPQQNATAGTVTSFGSYVICNGGAAGSYSSTVGSNAAAGTVTTGAGVTLLTNYYDWMLTFSRGQSQAGSIGLTGGNASGYGAGGGGGDVNSGYYIGQYGGGNGAPGLIILEY